MGLKFRINWLREDVVIPEGACDDGMEILKSLGYEERQYVEANELYDVWLESDKVPAKYKHFAKRYKQSKEGLETYVLKRYRSYDAIIEMNEFRIGYAGSKKTCKTIATLKKYKDEMVEKIYSSSSEYTPFVYVQGKTNVKIMIEPSEVKKYANSNVDIIIEDYHNNETKVTPSEFDEVYAKKVEEAKNLIYELEIIVQRRISDPDEFFEVWVPYSI